MTDPTADDFAIGTQAPLTLRQRMVLQFIADFRAQKGFAPTLREIGRHMGIRSSNGVNDHLRALERKGFIRREDVTARSIVLIGAGAKETSIPSDEIATDRARNVRAACDRIDEQLLFLSRQIARIRSELSK